MNTTCLVLAALAVTLNNPVATIGGRDNCKQNCEAFALGEPVAATPDMMVDLTLKCDKNGDGVLYWHTEDMRDFVSRLGYRFAIVGDGQWHTYQLRPTWGVTNRISKIRIDFPNNAASVLRSVKSAEFVRRGVVPFDSRAADGIVFRMTSDEFKYLSMNWLAVTGNALPRDFSMGFTSIPDGKEHVLWFDFKNTLERMTFGRPHWYGDIHGFTFRENLKSLEFWPKDAEFVKGVPHLPADPVVRQVFPEDAIPRAGRPLPIEIVVRNYGTVPVADVRFALEGLPEGVRPLNAAELAPKAGIAPSAGYDYIRDDYMPKGLPNERRYRITLSDPGKAMSFRAKLVLTARGGARSEKAFDVKVLPSLGLAKCDYPPEPKPVDMNGIDVGAFVFPGWSVHQWYPAWDSMPERRPVLGWYDDSNVEVRDWQIKYLVENGVSFVVVDWYWRAGKGPSWNYWVESFRKARYRKYLKYTVLWCNEGAYRHTIEDQKLITKYWIDNFFNDPQFMKIDGKPVVVMWSSQHMEDTMGKGSAKKLMDLSRQMAKEAGYPGIYFMCTRGDMEQPAYLAKFKQHSLDATCVYKYSTRWSPHWPGLVNGVIDYSAIADTSLTHWRTLKQNHDLPFWPSLSTGWGNFPWLGDRGWGIVNKTPEKFAKVCRDAKKFSEETGCKCFLMGPLDEWCEGEIGWPNSEHGFGLLEGVREAFAKKPPEGFPLNYAPRDVGLGPYTKTEAMIASGNRTALEEKIATKHRIITSDNWGGGHRTIFDFNGRKAWIIEPQKGRKGKSWFWTMQWMGAFLDRTGGEKLVSEDGYHHVHLDAFDTRASDEGLRELAAFQRYLVEELGFARKAKLIGMSWGGFYSIRYANAYPQNVSRIYLDAPLMNLDSIKKGIGPWEKLLPASGSWKDDPRMPINMAKAMVDSQIPILLLYGGVDSVLNPADNCELFLSRYKAAGGKPYYVNKRNLYGHHPHGFEMKDLPRLTQFFDDGF